MEKWDQAILSLFTIIGGLGIFEIFSILCKSLLPFSIHFILSILVIFIIFDNWHELYHCFGLIKLEPNGLIWLYAITLPFYACLPLLYILNVSLNNSISDETIIIYLGFNLTIILFLDILIKMKVIQKEPKNKIEIRGEAYKKLRYKYSIFVGTNSISILIFLLLTLFLKDAEFLGIPWVENHVGFTVGSIFVGTWFLIRYIENKSAVKWGEKLFKRLSKMLSE